MHTCKHIFSSHNKHLQNYIDNIKTNDNKNNDKKFLNTNITILESKTPIIFIDS